MNFLKSLLILAIVSGSLAAPPIYKGVSFHYRQYRLPLTEQNEDTYNSALWARVWVLGSARTYTRKDGTVSITPTDKKGFTLTMSHTNMRITVYQGGRLICHPYGIKMEGFVRRESPKNWVCTQAQDGKKIEVFVN